MIKKTTFFVGMVLICTSVFAGYKIESANHTDLKEAEINAFVTNIVKAINTNDQAALLPLLHPGCRKVLSKNEDVALFVKFMLAHTIPSTYKWKAGVFKKNSALFKINRLVITPTMCVDIFWNAPTIEKPEHVDALSVMFLRQDDNLFFVSYMNDYMKNKLKTSNRPDSCRRQSTQRELTVFPATTAECLKSSDFNAFLGSTNVVFRADNLGGSLFKDAPDYIGGGTLRSKHRGVGLAVFESHEAALIAVNLRRTNVANVIAVGAQTKDGINNWWFGEDQALLSIVHGNAVLEVTDIRRHYSEVEDELWRTARKLIKAAEQSVAGHPPQGVESPDPGRSQKNGNKPNQLKF